MAIDDEQLRAAGRDLGMSDEELGAHIEAINGLTTAFKLCAVSAAVRPQETENLVRELCHEDAINLALGGVMSYIELITELAVEKDRVKQLEAQLARLN